MYHVLLIQLHYPFVATGHLSSEAPSTARNSFAVCATAAQEIVGLLMAYNTTFSIRKAPYLISYATYVSATILVRIAAQKPSGSSAHLCLQVCLAVLNENQATNWVVSSAKLSLSNLMKRMGVVCRDDQDLSEIGKMQLPTISQNPSPGPQAVNQALSSLQGDGYIEVQPNIQMADPVAAAPDFDIDMILDSFGAGFMGETHPGNTAGHGHYPQLAHLPSAGYEELETSVNLEAVLLDPANTGYGPTIMGDRQHVGVTDTTDASVDIGPSTLHSRALGKYTM